GGGYTLKPGEAYTNGKIIKTNLEQDIAWKNGIFNFDHVQLKDAMRQLARWYDIEVEFIGKLDNIELRGEIGRDLHLQDVLSGLQDTNLHFQLNGKILRVSK
ncbi:MAG: DUF4974 domain-containing protein, partial [Chitinophagaceae bacterium]|nr:DUF4974 domain-containing protein [Chitinophagaceae bacterium]